MHRGSERTIEWKIAMRVSLAAQLEHRMIDPITRKPQYGLRSKLINALVEAWLRQNPSPLDASPLTEADLEALKQETAS